MFKFFPFEEAFPGWPRTLGYLPMELLDLVSCATSVGPDTTDQRLMGSVTDTPRHFPYCHLPEATTL